MTSQRFTTDDSETISNQEGALTEMGEDGVILEEAAEVPYNTRRQTKGTVEQKKKTNEERICLLYTSPSPRDRSLSRMPSSA